MELRQLQYFLAVAGEGHFTKAAEKLFISQSALSQQIKSLEEELETQLLDRGWRAVRLTPAGEILARHARRVLVELEEAQVALDELASVHRGDLRVGVVQTVNAYLMPGVIAAFTGDYPGVDLHIEERAAGEIERGVLEGTLQLGISFVPAALEGVEEETLFREALVLIVSQEHAFAGRASLAVSDLDKYPLLSLPRAFCTRRLWDRCAQEAGIEPRVQVEMNTIGGLLAAVRKLGGATVLPALALAGNRAEGLVSVRLRNPTPERTVGVVLRANGYRCPATRAFVRTLQEHIACSNELTPGRAE